MTCNDDFKEDRANLTADLTRVGVGITRPI